MIYLSDENLRTQASVSDYGRRSAEEAVASGTHLCSVLGLVVPMEELDMPRDNFLRVFTFSVGC